MAVAREEYIWRMQGLLFAFGSTVFLAFVALFLGIVRSRRKALDEIAALRNKIASLELRTSELEAAEIQYAEALDDLCGTAQLSAIGSDLAFNRAPVTLRQIARRLENLKSALPEDSSIGAEYVAEFHNLLSLVEGQTHLDLNSFRLPPQYNRTPLRVYILALLGLCAAHMAHPPTSSAFASASPKVADQIH